MSLFQIKTPCHEDWNSMKIGLRSRHCESCKKDVRIKVGIESIFIILFALNLLLLPIQTNSQVKKTNKSKDTIGTKYSRNNSFHKEKEVEVVTKKFVTKDELSQNIRDFVLSIYKNPLSQKPDNNMNSVTVACPVPFNYYDPNAVPNYAEIMPEFDGGYDSLVNFITSNLKYPDWERENKIEGTVYVGFTINKDGSISDILINVSVAGSKNFDSEVIRVISSMPKWIPGVNEGEKVRVRYHLPVRFKL